MHKLTAPGHICQELKCSDGRPCKTLRLDLGSELPGPAGKQLLPAGTETPEGIGFRNLLSAAGRTAFGELLWSGMVLPSRSWAAVTSFGNPLVNRWEQNYVGSVERFKDTAFEFCRRPKEMATASDKSCQDLRSMRGK